MRYEGVVITGIEYSGKSSIVNGLCMKYSEFEKVRSTTTREKRLDDLQNDYSYVSEKKFKELHDKTKFIIEADYRNKKYSYNVDDINEIKSKRKIPILIVTPEVFNNYKNNFKSYISIFIDVYDEDIHERIKTRDETFTEETLKRRNIDRMYKYNFHYNLINNKLEESIECIYNLWEYKNTGGLLTKDYMALMLKSGMLIEKYSMDNLKSSSYDLSLGDEYYYKGKISTLSVTDPFLVIEPYDCAIVTSKEKINLPNNVAGRFDLSVGLFCQGVILSNGPQVDPGFRGILLCMLFNTSNSEIYIKRGQHYSTIEFHKLIDFTQPYDGSYQDKENISDYLRPQMMQGAINELKIELEEIKRGGKQIQEYFLGVVSLILSIIALLLAIR